MSQMIVDEQFAKVQDEIINIAADPKKTLQNFISFLDQFPNIDINNIKDKQGAPLLYTIIVSRGKDTVDFLKECIKRGASINVYSPSKGYTPLMVAVMQNKNIEVIDFLLQKQNKEQPDVNAVDTKFGVNVLLYAMYKKYKEIAKLIINKAHGLNLNLRDEKGECALSFAIKTKDYDLVQLLLDKGADFNTKDNKTNSSLGELVQKGSDEKMKIIFNQAKEKLKKSKEESESRDLRFKNNLEYLKAFITGDVEQIEKAKKKIDADFIEKFLKVSDAISSAFFKGNKSVNMIFLEIAKSDKEKAIKMLELGLIDLTESGFKADLIFENLVENKHYDLAEKLVNFGVNVYTNISKSGEYRSILELYAIRKDLDALSFLFNEIGASPFACAFPLLDSARTRALDADEGDQKFVKELEKIISKRTKTPKQQDIPYLLFQNCAKLVIEAGHILGVSSAISVPFPGLGPQLIEMEGQYDYTPAKTMENVLNKYLNGLNTQHANPEKINKFTKIYRSFSLMEQYLRKDGTVTANDLHHELMVNKGIIALPIKMPQHSLTAAIVGKKLVLCNRGDGMLETGLTIFEIDELKNIDVDFIKNITKTNFESMNEILDFLSKHGIDVAKRIALKSKDQSHGTCSFVNKKSAAHGILYCLELLEGKTHDDAIKVAAEEYKEFTSWMRDDYLEGFLQDFDRYRRDQNKEVTEVMLQVMARYLLEHHGYKHSYRLVQTEKQTVGYTRPKSTIKRKHEAERAEKILAVLSETEKSKLFKYMAETEKGTRLLEFSSMFDKEFKYSKELLQKFNEDTLLFFTQALTSNNLDLVQYMLKNPYLSKYLNMGKPLFENIFPLQIAFMSKHDEMASLLIAHGASVSQIEMMSQKRLVETLLFHPIDHNIIKFLLIDCKIDPTRAFMPNGLTCLQYINNSLEPNDQSKIYSILEAALKTKELSSNESLVSGENVVQSSKPLRFTNEAVQESTSNTDSDKTLQLKNQKDSK